MEGAEVALGRWSRDSSGEGREEYTELDRMRGVETLPWMPEVIEEGKEDGAPSGSASGSSGR